MDQFDSHNAIIEMRSIFSDEQLIFSQYKDMHSANDLQSVHSLVITPNNKASFLKKKKKVGPIASQQTSTTGLSGVWQSKGLLVISLIIRFIYQLKLQTDSMKYKLLNKRIYGMICDVASDYQNIENYRLKNQIKQSYKIQIQYLNLVRLLRILTSYVLSKVPVFHPNEKFVLIYQALMIIVNILSLFMAPIQLSFLQEDSNLEFRILYLGVQILWIIIQFNLAFYRDQKLLLLRIDIALNYLLSHFVSDFLIVMSYSFYTVIGNYAELSFFFKLLQLRRIYNQFEQNIYLKDNLQALLQMSKLIVTLIFITHCCACSWHYLGVFERDTLKIHRNWLTYYEFEDLEWLESVITTLTVGYGDITPQSVWEKLFVIIVAMNLCGILGYTITNIGETFRNLNEKQQNYKTQMKAIEKIIRSRKLNEKLAIKVKKYFQHLFLQEQEDNNLGELLMQKLTRNLEEEVLMDTYYEIIRRSYLIRTFKKETIQKLCTKVKILKFAPGDEIIKSQQTADTLIFLLNGDVVVQTQQSRLPVTLKIISPGNVIGEQEFAAKQNYDYTLLSFSYTRIAVIARDQFYDILQFDAEEFEKMSKIKDLCIFNGNQKSSLGKTCEICGWTHGYLQCPFTFYQSNKMKILKQFTHSAQQERKIYSSRRIFKTNALQLTTHIQQKCINYMYNNDILEQSSKDDSQDSNSSRKRRSLDLQSNTESSEALSFGDLESKKLAIPKTDQDSKKAHKHQVFFSQNLQIASNFQRLTNLDKRNNDLLDTLTPPVIKRNPHKKVSYQENHKKKDENNYSTNQILELILTKLNNNDKSEKEITYVGYNTGEEDLDFEVMQSYKFYFPNFNVDHVIKQVNEYNELLQIRHAGRKKGSIRLFVKRRQFGRQRRVNFI